MTNPAAKLQGTFVGETCVSAAEFARLAGVEASDVYYWGRSGYLKKRSSASSPFPLSQLPEAALMGIFVKKLHMNVASASRLAEQLLPVYASNPGVVEAFRTLADVVESRIDGLARLMMETDFGLQLEELMKSKPPKKTEP